MAPAAAGPIHGHDPTRAAGQGAAREAAEVLAWRADVVHPGLPRVAGQGLLEPAIVTTATEGYRDESDILGDFIDECCVVAQHEQASAGKLYEAYGTWCKMNGHDPDNSTVFGRKLTERGFLARKTSSGSKVRDGIGLTNATTGF